MSPERQPIDEATREQLVAYLDGELADGESRDVESRLAKEDGLRDEVQGLDRVWNALDDLPQATVGESFAKTTIEMVAVEAKRDVATMTAALPVQRRRRGYALAGACVGALLLGFTLARVAIMKPQRELIANLPVVYQVDALQNFRDADFLRKLQATAPNLLATGDGEALEATAGTWRSLASEDFGQRADRVAAFSDNEKTRLLDATRRYQRDLSPKRRDTVEAVYEQINTAADRETLMRTAVAYEAWLSTRTASDRARLRELEPTQRLKALSKIERQLVAQARSSLPAKDSAALRAAVASVADAKELRRIGETVQARLKEFSAAQASRSRGPESVMMARMSKGVSEWVGRARKSPALSVLFLADVSGRYEHGLSRVFREDWDAVHEQAVEDWQFVESRLVASLTPGTRERLNKLPVEQRRRALSAWVLQAAQDAFESFDEEAFFASDQINDEERHALLALPSDQMSRELRSLYVERQLGGFGRGARGDIMRRLREGMSRGFGGPGGGFMNGPGLPRDEEQGGRRGPPGRRRDPGGDR